MSNILGNKIGILVNNTGILASSATIAQTNTISNTYFLGGTTTNFTAPQGPYKTELSINYLPFIEGDPNYHILNSLKTIRSGEGIGINLGGVTGLFYLNNYSFKIGANSAIFLTCAYTCYNNLTGTFTGIQFNTTGNINELIGTSCAITWGGAATEIDDIYSLDYQAQIGWKPSYKIGQKEPYKVTYLSMEETYNVETENSFFIDFYGSMLGSVLSGYTSISLKPAIDTGASPQVYSLSSSKLQSINIPISNSDVIRNRYTFIKNY